MKAASILFSLAVQEIALNFVIYMDSPVIVSYMQFRSSSGEIIMVANF